MTSAEIFNKKKTGRYRGRINVSKEPIRRPIDRGRKCHENSRLAGFDPSRLGPSIQIRFYQIEVDTIFTNVAAFSKSTLQERSSYKTDRDTAERNRKTTKRATPDDEANQVTQRWLTCDAALKHLGPGSLEASFLEMR